MVTVVHCRFHGACRSITVVGFGDSALRSLQKMNDDVNINIILAHHHTTRM